MNSTVESLIAKLNASVFPGCIPGYTANKVEARLNAAGDRVQVIVHGEVDVAAGKKPVRSSWEIETGCAQTVDVDTLVALSFDMMAKRIEVDIKAFQVVA